MKLEDQVCSLELAKKLKELGVKQDSVFIWDSKNDHYELGIKFIHESLFNHLKLYSAFSVAELGELLPGNCESSKFTMDLNNKWCGNIYTSEDFYDDDTLESFETDTEANARALMLIYLIENELIEGYQ